MTRSAHHSSSSRIAHTASRTDRPGKDPSRFKTVGTGAVLALALAAVISCGPPAEQAPAEPVITNSNLNLVVEAPGPEWTLTANEDDRISLAPGDPEKAGSVTLTAGAPEPNVNLVLAVKAHQEAIEQRPGGQYFGAQELGGSIGTAFYSRGRFTDSDGSTIEEVSIFGLHPSESRMLQLVYRYPAAEDSGERVSSLIGLLALIGPSTANAPQPSTESDQTAPQNQP